MPLSLCALERRTLEDQLASKRASRRRWYLLALASATGTFVAAMPFACLPVLFEEISGDLNLSLVQVGAIWGASGLATIVVSLIGGILGDRFGVKRLMIFACVFVGVTGALRGLSGCYATLAATVFLNGLVRSVVPVNITKGIANWFRGDRLGFASGIMGLGMGVGLMLGSMISATYLSPLLGGWRNVLYFYGAISAAMGIFWVFSPREEPSAGPAVPSAAPARPPLGQALRELLRRRGIWLISLTIMLRQGAISGLTGYMALYLRDRGWTDASADDTLGIFYLVSALSVIPLCTLSDRIGSRKAILFAAAGTTVVSLGLLPFVDGAIVWLLMGLTGMFMDSFMALSSTMLLETEGVGPLNSGTAVGIVFTIAPLGSVFAPPVGNGLSRFNAALPFAFWAALAAASIVTMALTRETGRRRSRSAGKLTA